MSFDDLLLLIITDEINRRNATVAPNRANEAGLDQGMTLELFDRPPHQRGGKVEPHTVRWSCFNGAAA
jgi:hypothetical protein